MEERIKSDTQNVELIELFSRIPNQRLLALVPNLPIKQQVIDQLLLDKNALARLVLDFLGSRIFESTEVLLSILSLFSLKQLNESLSDFGRNSESSVYDAALTFASIKSREPLLFQNAFDKLLGEIGFRALTHGHRTDNHIRSELPLEDITTSEYRIPFDYQKEVSQQLQLVVDGNDNRAMLQMPTGSGKTYTVMQSLVHSIIEDVDRPRLIVWIAHNRELCEQACASFRIVWSGIGKGRVRIHRLWGTFSFFQEHISKGIIVASFQKLHSLLTKKSALLSAIMQSCDTMIIDEAHKSLAPSYLSLIDSFHTENPKLNLIGLSATPGRGAGDRFGNSSLAELYGDNLITPNFDGVHPLEALRERGILATLKRHVITSDREIVPEENFGGARGIREFSSDTLASLSVDSNRNDKILEEVLNLSRQGLQVLVFACTVDHAKLMSAVMNAKSVCSRALYSGMDINERSEAIEDFREGHLRVLTNYEILTTGFDAPNVGAVVITRPTTSLILYSQMIGRGLRGKAVGGSDSCLLIDVVDNVTGMGTEESVYSYFDSYWESSVSK